MYLLYPHLVVLASWRYFCVNKMMLQFPAVAYCNIFTRGFQFFYYRVEQCFSTGVPRNLILIRPTTQRNLRVP